MRSKNETSQGRVYVFQDNEYMYDKLPLLRRWDSPRTISEENSTASQ
jgi:hypothetical protein